MAAAPAPRVASPFVAPGTCRTCRAVVGLMRGLPPRNTARHREPRCRARHALCVDERVVPPLRTRRRALTLLLVLLAPALALGWLGLSLPIDVENRSLKAPGTPDAIAMQRRVAHFGRDEELLVVFQALPLGQGALAELELAALAKLRREVEHIEGVASVRETPATGPAARSWSISLAAPGGDYAPQVEAVDEHLRSNSPSTVRVSLSGLPMAELVLARELQAEQARVVPWVAGVLAALLLAIYRRIGLVVAILAPPGLALLAIQGIQALWGRELTPVSVLLPPVLLTVGVAAGVHWIEAYLDGRSAGAPAETAARDAIRELRQPALLAALTTVIGFLALAFNPIPAVADFGVLAALGVALTYAVAVLATPALLVLLAPVRELARLRSRGAWTHALGPRVADALVRHAPAIRSAAWTAAGLGLVLCTQLEVDNDPLRVLPAGHDFLAQTSQVASELGGSEVFDVLAPAGSPLADPVQLGLFAAAVCELPGVAGPAGPAWIAEQGDWLARFVLAPGGSGEREQLFTSVEARAAALGAPQTLVTGLAVQVARDSGRMVRGALWGAVSGLGLLWLVFWIGFRSASFAWLAIVPNALPCIVVNAGLALWGAPLSFATAIISSTMLGLIVDDTIHMLHRFRDLRASGRTALASIEGVYRQGGRAIVITSVTLALGFGAGAVGELTTSVEFSALAALTIVTAFFADLILLPAILVRTATKAVTA
jgi:uncharacterized membrane protein YdfJ with MMPL/SSD domain